MPQLNCCLRAPIYRARQAERIRAWNEVIELWALYRLRREGPIMGRRAGRAAARLGCRLQNTTTGTYGLDSVIGGIVFGVVWREESVGLLGAEARSVVQRRLEGMEGGECGVIESEARSCSGSLKAWRVS